MPTASAAILRHRLTEHDVVQSASSEHDDVKRQLVRFNFGGYPLKGASPDEEQAIIRLINRNSSAKNEKIIQNNQ
jgi:hypothetical protein